MNSYSNHLLDDHLFDPTTLVKASKTKRFINYLIDMAGMYTLGFLFAIFYILVQEDDTVFDDMGYWSEHLFGVVIMLIYYLLTESLLQGKTLGKYFTKTRAINKNGYPMGTKELIQRSLSRIVPFDAFSFLGEMGSGWHDKWSDTMVIDEKNSDY